jgi:dihydroflavonol-4-reductase
MRAFVTGGTGFVGSHVLRSLLKEGYKVTVLVRENSNLGNVRGLEIDIVKGDLNDPNIWKSMQNCNYLFHVAAHYSLWQKERHLLYDHNVEGTRNILAAAQKAGIERTVYTSSVAAIGVGKFGQVVDENHQTPAEKLVGDYKKSKFLAEQVAKEAVTQGQDIVIVNPSSPIGPLDIKPTPTGDIILRFLRRKMPAYMDTGLNFIDVRDVAKGHLLALKKGKTGDRYILGNQNLSLKELLQILSEITGLPAPRISLPAFVPLTVAWVEEKILTPLGKSPTVPIDGVRMAQQPMYYDASKAISELGLPQSSLKVALKDAVDWFLCNGYVK